MKSVYSLNEQEFLKDTEGYFKTKSMIYLKMLGLPTLKGLIITKWDKFSEESVLRFIEQNGFSSLVLRTDSVYEIGPAPRGGDLIEISLLKETVIKYLNMGRIVILLEPRSRFENLYSFNVLFDRELFPRHILVETVGPGFDVSDISRGDISPHERIWIPRSEFLQGPLLPTHIFRQVTNQLKYLESYNDRLVKIGRKVTGKNMTEELLKEEAIKYLRRRGWTLLLQKQTYTPVPFAYIQMIYQNIKNLPSRLYQLNAPGEPFVVSGTIFNQTNELIFWDITWARLKYQLKRE